VIEPSNFGVRSTGAPPFRGVPVEVAAAHRLRELPALPPAVPAGVAALIAELTVKDPAARPASAGEVARRAGQLRDALAAGSTAVLPTDAIGSPTATRVDAQPTALVGAPAVGGAPARRWDLGRSWRAVALAVALVVVGLACWLLVGMIAAPPQRPPATPRAAARTPGTRTAEVDASALLGQRAGAVSHRLRQLGLHPHVVRAINGGQAPGTVISVQPSGQVPVGSAITVTVALQPPGHDHGHGHGDGHGGGNGQGDGNGGD